MAMCRRVTGPAWRCRCWSHRTAAPKTTRPATADRIAAQWAAIDGIDAIADEVEYGQVPGGRSYTRTTYRDAAGQSLIERYMINGAGHACHGGCACSLYGDTAGPDASNLTWDFFLAHSKP